MNRTIWIILGTSLALLFAHGMPTRALSPAEAALVGGLDDDEYDCEECYYWSGTRQCSGLWLPDDFCHQVADPPVLGQTCDGSCAAIFCDGDGVRGYCSRAGIIEPTLCECTENGEMQCGYKAVVTASCKELWADPGNGQLEFLNCECPNLVYHTQEPCMDADVDYLNTSCPGGSVVVFTYPENFDRSQLLASIR